MKKIIAVVLSALMLTAMLTGCSSDNADNSNDNRISIVVTTFPQYDWVREILGDRINDVELTLLLDNGVDLHSFQPTADDIISISRSDMFVYVGGESDSWVDDALKQSSKDNLVAVNLMDTLGESVKAEEVKEGMQAEDEEDSEEQEYDEHIWLSLKNAEVLCREIARSLCEIDSANADTYTSNANAYIERLDALDREFESAVSDARIKTLLFADRFPFRYLADDYSLDYYAAFVGCSAETEASFETIKFLADKVDELGLDYVLKIDNSDGKIAQTVIDNTDSGTQEIITLNSMQAITLTDIENGVSYIDIMEQNLNAVCKALN